MNSFDQQKAARVWQRVQESKPEQKPQRVEELPELIVGEIAAAAAYRQLARQMPKEAAVFQRISREEQSHSACLQGIHTLTTGQRCPVQPTKMRQEPTERILHRCYGMELRSIRAYESRCDDPEYGHVFARMAQQEREHCAALLEIIGGLEKK